MNYPAGYTVTILRPSTKGKNSRRLSMTRPQARIKRKPHASHVSSKPRRV